MDRLIGTMSSHIMSAGIGSVPSMSGRIGSPREGTVILDETLTVHGRAADAKAVGDRFAIVEQKIDHLETEVGDASLLLSLI